MTLPFPTPLFTDLPEAVLAAIIVVAVNGLLKFAAMRTVWTVNRPEAWLGGLTAGQAPPPAQGGR